jgi:hypothetical protein
MNRYDLLYYPYINFRDEDWLKMAALYGDSVSRIVPVNYPTRKTETVVALQENDFIRDISPVEAGPKPAHDFSEFLLTFQDLLRPAYAVDKTQSWGSDPDDRHLEDEEVTKRAYVEASKLSGARLEALQKTGLLVKGRDGDINWIGMHPRLANLYMTMLANELTKHHKGLRLTADFASHHVNVHATSMVDMERVLLPELLPKEEPPPPVDKHLAKSVLATFVFKKLIPVGLSEVPVETILKLRETHLEDLVKYQTTLDDFVNGDFMAEIETLDELQDHIEKTYAGTIQPALERLEKALYLSKIKFWAGLAAVSFMPVAAVTIPPAPVILGAVAGACGLMSLTSSARSELDGSMATNSYSWLYRVEKGLQPQTLVGQIAQAASAFIYPH